MPLMLRLYRSIDNFFGPAVNICFVVSLIVRGLHGPNNKPIDWHSELKKYYGLD